MTTIVRIVSSQPDTFARVRNVGGEEEICHCPQWDRAILGPRDDTGVRRLRPGMGHVLNEGPRPVRLYYTYDGKRVGPTTDYLAPGAFKELGLGPDVTWWLREVA